MGSCILWEVSSISNKIYCLHVVRGRHLLNLAPTMMSFIFDTDRYNQSAKLGNGVIAPENVCLLSVTISCFLVHPHFAVFVQGASNFHFFIPEFLTPELQSNYECSRCHLGTFQDVLK